GERLDAEGGEGRVAAADADHHELTRGAADQEAPIGSRERAEESDHEGPGHVDDDGAPRERLADALGHEPREPIPPHAAQRAADRDPEINEQGCLGRLEMWAILPEPCPPVNPRFPLPSRRCALYNGRVPQPLKGGDPVSHCLMPRSSGFGAWIL